MIYSFGDCELDTDLFELRRDGNVCPTELQVFDLLKYLVEHRDRVVTKDELLDAIWRGRLVSDSALSSRIKSARRAVGDSGKRQAMISTIRGRGFRFVGDVSSGAAATGMAPGDKAERQGTDGDNGRNPEVPAAAPKVPVKPSIAVLPFVNMSGDPRHEHVADGITEDIVTAFVRCRWLRVIARNSAFVYRDNPVDVRQIASDLGVRYVLEGSIRQSAGRVRVTAQLIDGHDGGHLWAEHYDRELDDTITLQDDIAAVIVGTLEPELENLERAALRGRPAVNMNAWDCYLQGLWHLYRFTLDKLELARTLFERAIALDQTFAQAYARLAYVHIQLGWYGPNEDRVERVGNAIALARQAIDIDDRDPSARLSLGRALTLSGELEQGVEELRTAVRLDPSFAQAHFALGQTLCYLERYDDAISEINEALRLSPRDPHLWTFLNVRALARYGAEDMRNAELDELAALRQPNATHWPYLVLAAVHGRQKNAARASDVIARLHLLKPGFGCSDAKQEFYFGEHPFVTERFIKTFVADLRRAGLPDQERPQVADRP